MFYSAQANSMLKQYENIERLLGPPLDDWQWSGTLCEVLLRNAIRQCLPSGYSVDKGYIHGARGRGPDLKRCPEIDILIHDSHMFAPMFRMDDFVIVMPEAVVGAIQVKRTLDASSLEKSLDNIIEAKRHVRDTCHVGGGTVVQKMFSAVVSFEGRIQDGASGVLSKTYKTQLAKRISQFSDGFLLPDFVGSIDTCFLLFRGVNVNSMYYTAFGSLDGEKNVALQALILTMQKKIFQPGRYPQHIDPKGPLGFEILKVHEGGE